MTAGLPLMKNVLASLAKSVLISLGLTDATIQKKKKKKLKSGTTTWIVLNEEMVNIMKIWRIRITNKCIETIKDEAKEQKGEFLPILLRTLAASILGNALSGRGVIRAGEGTITAGKTFNTTLSFN